MFIKSKEEFFQGVTGFYEGIEFSDYKALKAINSTSLKEMFYSPLHCHYAFTVGREDTDALSLGRTSHIALFEPERFNKMLVVPEFTGKTQDGKESSRSKEAKEKKDAWLKEHEGIEFVEQDEYDTAKQLADATLKHPGARKLLEKKAYNELTGVWTDPVTGLLCKLRMDRFIRLDEIPTIVDAKTYSDRAIPENVNREIYRRKYYFSKTWYLRGINEILGEKKEARSILIFIETQAPHGVLPYELDTWWIENGNKEINSSLRKFKVCQDKNEWPGYSQEMILSQPQSWMFSM